MTLALTMIKLICKSYPQLLATTKKATATQIDLLWKTPSITA
jgi:hypothetical protein